MANHDLPADLNAAYAAACARATDTAYRFAVALEECFAPTDSPRTWDAVGRLDFAAERLGELRQLIGIQEPPPRGAQPEED